MKTLLLKVFSTGRRAFPGIAGLLALACLFWSAAISVRAADYYVRPPGTTSTDASPYDSWATAATQIQWAVDVAMTNLPATVWVTNGQYCVTNQVTITNSITVRSVSGYTNTIVYSGWPAWTTRVFYAVNTGIVDGFTISNGHVDGHGAGIYLNNAAMVRNCYISHNVCIYRASAWYMGGGAYLEGSSIISNCIVYTNYSRSSGCGIHLKRSTALDCTVISNYDSTHAIQGQQSSLMSNCVVAFNPQGVYAYYFTVIGCVISNNRGVGLSFLNKALVSNCVIVNNRSAGAGGGISGEGAWDHGKFFNCVIARNTSASFGGGVYSVNTQFYSHCTINNNVSLGGIGGGGVAATNGIQLLNCLIVNNTNLSATGNGGGIALFNASTVTNPLVGVVNCTIANNYSTNEGGGIAVFGKSNNIINCIVAGNGSSSGNYHNVYAPGASSNNFWYSCANAALPPLQGNITSSPAFVDPGAGNYRLSASSPCVNAGINQDWMTNAVDLGGNIRIRYSAVDMGSYECIYDGTVYNLW